MYHIYHIFCISGSVCHIYLICHIWRCSMLSAMWHICPCLCQVPYPVDLPYLLIFPCQVPSAMYSIYLICRFCPLWSCVRPNQARASLLLCDFKAPTEFSSSKKSNLLSGRFLEIRKLQAGPPPLQRERQLGAGSHGAAAQRTFLKMSKLARLLKMLASICRGEMKACQGKMREDIWGSGQVSGFSGSVYGAVEVEAPTMSWGEFSTSPFDTNLSRRGWIYVRQGPCCQAKTDVSRMIKFNSRDTMTRLLLSMQPTSPRVKKATSYLSATAWV